MGKPTFPTFLYSPYCAVHTNQRTLELASSIEMPESVGVLRNGLSERQGGGDRILPSPNRSRVVANHLFKRPKGRAADLWRRIGVNKLTSRLPFCMIRRRRRLWRGGGTQWREDGGPHFGIALLNPFGH